jgi:hypothetical protein
VLLKHVDKEFLYKLLHFDTFRAKGILFFLARNDKRDLERVGLGGGEKDRRRHTRQESFVPPFVTKKSLKTKPAPHPPGKLRATFCYKKSLKPNQRHTRQESFVPPFGTKIYILITKPAPHPPGKLRATFCYKNINLNTQTGLKIITLSN